jgi:UDP-GlcNAc3NAcA epimerase
MDMPEEINRILTDRISDFLYCPTQNAVDNLTAEGFENFKSTVVRTGDVMLDASLYYAQFSAERASLDPEFLKGDFVLCTLHRAENTDDPARLAELVNALNTIHKERKVILPLHPRTRQKLKSFNIELKTDIIDPVGYFDMIELLKHCSLVMTDSGGLQKEAFFFGKNCVTLRDQTEWVELVDNGYNVLARAESHDIILKYREMSSRKNNFATNLYGDGKSAEAIVQHLVSHAG